jgi:uncharacterized protein involved in tellurium resistance
MNILLKFTKRRDKNEAKINTNEKQTIEEIRYNINYQKSSINQNIQYCKKD